MSFDIVCFDCDSTLSKVEGIDELAKEVGLGKEMAELTDSAMNGELPLEAVYERRLSLIGPDQQAVDRLAAQYVDEVVEGAVEVIRELQKNGKQVHIISGGIRQAILPLAEYLGVPVENVHAVDVIFDIDGQYQGFDSASPLARSGGKAEVCRTLTGRSSSLVMVGDGQTDLESKQAGAFFIGFGGVVERKGVRAESDYYVAEPSLYPLKDYILSTQC